MSRSPFKLLEAYDRKDVDRFYGRERETAQLYNAVHASNLVLVHGASGTGKTSLIQCGLGGQFIETDWLPVFVRRGWELNRALESAIANATTGKAPGTETPISERIRRLYLSYYRPIYLIFDQFEELFILGKKSEQEEFYGTIREILEAGTPSKVLLVMRDEYIAALSDFEKVVPSLFDTRLRIERMTDRNLKAVILGSASKEGVRVVNPEETVAKILENLRDLRTGVDLTNLQVYLDRLWRVGHEAGKREQVTFDPRLVDKVGRVEDVLSVFVAEQLADIEDGLRDRGIAEADGLPLELLWTLVTDDGTKQGRDISQILGALPPDRNIEQSDVLFCLDELERVRLVRQW